MESVLDLNKKRNQASMNPVLFVGLDAHKESIVAATAPQGDTAVQLHGKIGTTPAILILIFLAAKRRKSHKRTGSEAQICFLVLRVLCLFAANRIKMGIGGSTLDAFDECIRKLAKSDQELWFGHEAGRCGYVIYRHLKKGRHPCKTIVPSLIPTKASDPVKTDRRINEWLPAPFWSHRLVTSGRPGPGQFEANSRVDKTMIVSVCNRVSEKNGGVTRRLVKELYDLE